jgi:phenylacetate-CoA ligase
MQRGWQIPFYQRLWTSAGLTPKDINSLEDITRLPTYDKTDIMASIEQHPPFGDFSGWPAPKGGNHVARQPVIFHTTSGTTGKPQTLMFGAKGREIGNLLVARMYQWQGLTGEDVVHSVYGHGTINGGHYIREAVTHFSNALFISAGTGHETPSQRQVQLMAEFGATVVVGFVDYIRKLADVAREHGLQPGENIPVRMISGHLGMEDRAGVEAAWAGANAFDWYGVGDTGCIAGEGPDRNGLYVWEDAHYLEILDIDKHTPVAPGDKGNMVCTCLYKDDIFPVIRFNTHDVSAECVNPAQSDMVFKRIEGFLGRSDNMIKLRGINIFPHAVASVLAHRNEFAGEYVCIVTRDGNGRDQMQIKAEVNVPPTPALSLDYAKLLHHGLGVVVDVSLMNPGDTAPLTQIEQRQKPLRLIDRRWT